MTADPKGIDVCHVAFGGLGGQTIVVRMLAEQFAAHGLRNAAILYAPPEDLDADPAHWPHLDPIVAIPRGGRVDGAALLAVARHVRAMRPRVVLCHTHEAVAAVFLGQLLAGQRPRVVLVEHQSFGLRRRTEDVRSALALPFCRAVVVFTAEYARRYPLRRLPLRAVRHMTVITNGVDTERYHPTDRSGDRSGDTTTFTIGRGCRLVPYKDLETLIDAIAVLARQPETRHVRLLLAGEGPERPAVERRVRELGLEDRVELVGRLDEPQMLSFYASLDAYALATLGESVSMAMLEAFACGLPVVASDVTGVHGVARHGEDALVVPPGDPEAFAAALTRLATDPELADRLGSAARRRVEQEFSAEATADGYLDLMRRLA